MSIKILVFFTLACLTSNVYGSDHWDDCSSADGYIQIGNGVLSIKGIGEIAPESVKTKVLSTIRREEEKCVLKGTKTEVIAYDNTITVEEVEYKTEENSAPEKAVLICERGGSGIPASGECK